MEELNEYVPLLNMAILFILAFLARRAKLDDKKNAEFKKSMLEAVDQKLTKFGVDFMKELDDKFVTKQVCHGIHEQVERFADLPGRVSNIEGRLRGNG